MRLLNKEDCHIASVSPFYRVLRRHGEVTPHGRAHGCGALYLVQRRTSPQGHPLRDAGEDKGILAQRHVLYQAARRQNPTRWSGKTRHWNPVETASLNPTHKSEITPAQQAA
jgi:hypothetical protein